MIARRMTLGLLAAPLILRPASANWPDKPIRMLHGFGPGGTADILARLLATPIGDALGQPVIVESRPGAGGNIASAQLARAPADGNTLALLTGGHAVSRGGPRAAPTPFASPLPEPSPSACTPTDMAMAMVMVMLAAWAPP